MTTASPLVGIGYRYPIGDWISAHLDSFDVLEVTVDHYLYGGMRARSAIETLARRVPIIAHSVGLSLGTDAPLDEAYLREVAHVVRLLGSRRYSEHLAFTKVPGLDLGNLLPLPRTPEIVEWIVEKIRRARALLPVPFDLENISYLFDWPESSMSDSDFLRAVCEASGAGVLLDVENVYVNAHNHGFNADAALAEIPARMVRGMHIAGGCRSGSVMVDSHDHAVPAGALDLLDRALSRFRPETVVLERDDRMDAFDEILADIAGIRSRVGRPAAEAVQDSPPRSFVFGGSPGFVPLIGRQRAVLEFLTNPRAAPGSASLEGLDSDRLCLMRELSVGKRLEKVRSCFPVTLSHLEEPTEAVCADFVTEFPPYDIGRAENARQFSAFLTKRWEQNPPRRAYVRDVAQVELAMTMARRSFFDGATNSRTSAGATVRRSAAAQFVHCHHDVRVLFDGSPDVPEPFEREVWLLILPPAPDEEDAGDTPRVVEISADLYAALLAVGEESPFASADALGIGAPPDVIRRLLNLGALELAEQGSA